MGSEGAVDAVAGPSPAPLDVWRGEIARAAVMVAFYAENADRYASVGDDAGLEYSIRCLIPFVRHAAGLLKDLKDDKARLAALEPA